MSLGKNQTSPNDIISIQKDNKKPLNRIKVATSPEFVITTEIKEENSDLENNSPANRAFQKNKSSPLLREKLNSC